MDRGGPQTDYGSEALIAEHGSKSHRAEYATGLKPVVVVRSPAATSASALELVVSDGVQSRIQRVSLR
jgi:hypothetical protein